MKNRGVFICLCLLPLLAGCVGAPVSKEEDCHKQAEDRLELYNKPDVYPITETEKHNALTALFDECMREREGYYKREPDSSHAKLITQTTTEIVRKPEEAPPARPPYIPPPPGMSAYSPVTITDQPLLKPAAPANALPVAPLNRELENIITSTN